MSTVTIPYDCLVCHASCPATVTGLDDPLASIEPRTQALLGKAAVDELAAEILQQGARSTLVYATCPRCGAKNPEGVAKLRRSKVIMAVLLVALAAGAWFVRWCAVALPVLDLLVVRPSALVRARRSGLPVSSRAIAASVAADLAFVAVVVLVPRAAPLVPLVQLVALLARPSAWEWSHTKANVRFEGG